MVLDAIETISFIAAVVCIVYTIWDWRTSRQTRNVEASILTEVHELRETVTEVATQTETVEITGENG